MESLERLIDSTRVFSWRYFHIFPLPNYAELMRPPTGPDFVSFRSLRVGFTSWECLLVTQNMARGKWKEQRDAQDGAVTQEVIIPTRPFHQHWRKWKASSNCFEKNILQSVHVGVLGVPDLFFFSLARKKWWKKERYRSRQDIAKLLHRSCFGSKIVRVFRYF